MPADAPDWLDYRPPTPISRREILVRVAVGIVAALLLAWILVPHSRSRPLSNRVKCASNMKQIGQAFLFYSNENRNLYPPDLATALATQDLVPEVFVCPMSNSERATTRFTFDVTARAAKNLDYVYTGEGLKNNVRAEEPILFERLFDHDHEGGNALFGDGHVEFIMKPQILKLLEPLRGTPRLTDEEYDAIVAK
jgi:prepilin-type processing-associated H-X9-DG protein